LLPMTRFGCPGYYFWGVQHHLGTKLVLPLTIYD
jgi:hypothetical protein